MLKKMFKKIDGNTSDLIISSGLCLVIVIFLIFDAGKKCGYKGAFVTGLIVIPVCIVFVLGSYFLVPKPKKRR